MEQQRREKKKPIELSKDANKTDPFMRNVVHYCHKFSFVALFSPVFKDLLNFDISVTKLLLIEHIWLIFNIQFVHRIEF